MATTMEVVIGFVISLIISSIIIYVVSKLFGEKEGFGTAILAGLIGSVVYAASYYFLGTGLLAALIGGIAWLIVLGSLYKIGWVKSLIIAVVVWIVATLVSLILPTMIGPL